MTNSMVACNGKCLAVISLAVVLVSVPLSVAGGCYAGAKAAGGRLDWSDVFASCSQ